MARTSARSVIDLMFVVQRELYARDGPTGHPNPGVCYEQERMIRATLARAYAISVIALDEQERVIR